MENNTWEVIFSNLSGIITAIGGFAAAYYAFVIKKKTGEQKTIAQLQEHVALLMERDAKKDKSIGEMQEQNVKQVSSIQTLTYKLENMDEDISELREALDLERKEKVLYQEKYQNERLDKLRILDDNKKMLLDIERLKAEVRTLKSQLGMQID